MTLSAFADPSQPPSHEDLREVLGPAAELWEQLLAHMAGAYGPTTECWACSGGKNGWSLRLKRKDRVLLYLTPQAGQFRLGVVLGERAARAAQGPGCPPQALLLIDAAPRYAEGRGVRLQVATREDLATALALAGLKVNS